LVVAASEEYNGRVTDSTSADKKPDAEADKGSAFGRFERLTKSLLGVPKSEIDAAREKAKRGVKRQPTPK
jgi:hypothetical protein